MLSEYEWQAIVLSLQVSTVAVIISLPFGILMAWLLVRVRFPGKSLLDSIIHLPLVLPPVVVGYLLLISMGIGIYVLHALIAGTAVPGWSSLILSIWLVGGMLMVSIGVVGIYIGKIFIEVKHRPLYHISEIL